MSFGSKCSAFREEDACESQLACTWLGDTVGYMTSCQPGDEYVHDKVYKKRCATHTQHEDCEAMHGCEWRESFINLEQLRREMNESAIIEQAPRPPACTDHGKFLPCRRDAANQQDPKECAKVEGKYICSVQPPSLECKWFEQERCVCDSNWYGSSCERFLVTAVTQGACSVANITQCIDYASSCFWELEDLIDSPKRDMHNSAGRIETVCDPNCEHGTWIRRTPSPVSNITITSECGSPCQHALRLRLIVDELVEWAFLSVIIDAVSVLVEALVGLQSFLSGHVNGMLFLCFFAGCASSGELVIEMKKLMLITGSNAKDDALLLANGIKDDKCFTLGQGSDTVKDLFDTVEDMKQLSFGHIGIACFQLFVSFGSICYHSGWSRALWRRFWNRKRDNSPGHDVTTESSQRKRDTSNCSKLLSISMAVVPTFIELGVAVYDWSTNARSLQRDFSEVMAAFGQVNGQLAGGGKVCAYASDTARLDLEGLAVNGSFTCGKSSPSGLIIKTSRESVLAAVLPVSGVLLLGIALCLRWCCRHYNAHPQQSTRALAQVDVQVDENVTVTQTHDPAWSDHVNINARPTKPTRGDEQPTGAMRVVLAEAVCQASSTDLRIRMPHPFSEISESRCSSDRSSRPSSSRGSFGLRISTQQRAAHLFSRVSELASEASPGRRISMRFARRASQAQVEATQVRMSATDRDSGRSSRFSGLSTRASNSRASQSAASQSASPEQPTLRTRPRRGSVRVLHVGLSPESPCPPARHNLQVSSTVEGSPVVEGSPALVHSGTGSFEAAAREPRRANELNTTSL